MNKNIPNAISICRIIFSIPMFFIETMSVPFIVLYIVAFATDLVDGNLARLTHTCSDLGKKLDSIGDFTFFLVFLFRIVPWMAIEPWEMVWFILIVASRLGFFLWVKLKKCKFMPSHSIASKITGTVIFVLPFFYLWLGPICLPPALALASLSIFSDFNNARKLIREQCPPKALS